jgi:hypothetical protein
MVSELLNGEELLIFGRRIGLSMRSSVWMLSIAVLLGGQIGLADVFNITRDNSGGALCSAGSPCGTVTVTGTSLLHVAVSLNSPFGVFGNKDAFGFNVVGTTTGVNIAGVSPGTFNGGGGSGNEDGFGNYMFRIDGPGGSGAVSSLSFDVSRSGTPFTSPSDIEAGGSGGNGSTTFALHIRNNSTGFTGFAAVTSGVGQTPVPEPTSILLLATAVLGAGYSARKRLARRL